MCQRRAREKRKEKKEEEKCIHLPIGIPGNIIDGRAHQGIIDVIQKVVLCFNQLCSHFVRLIVFLREKKRRRRRNSIFVNHKYTAGQK